MSDTDIAIEFFRRAKHSSKFRTVAIHQGADQHASLLMTDIARRMSAVELDATLDSAAKGKADYEPDDDAIGAYTHPG